MSYRTMSFRDPDLPGDLLPEGWPGRRVHDIFIAAHDAPHEPADRFVRETVAQHWP
jgi:phenylacetic acid degradation operon negative regulatory protein